MNKCTNCNKEFEGRSDAKFCSDSCRIKRYRTVVTDNVVTDNKASNVTAKSGEPIIGIFGEDIRDYGPQELYDAIAVYAEDSWVNSPEYALLDKRLKAWTEEKLREEGYYVPQWKIKNKYVMK